MPPGGQRGVRLNGLSGKPPFDISRASLMSLHQELSFEIEICEHLTAHGWLYAEGDAVA